MFERLLRHWQTTEAEAEAPESWRAFSERVARGLKQIVDRPGTGRRVAAFTSGGFIGTAMQQVLGCRIRRAGDQLANSERAVSEFVFARGRITLESVQQRGAFWCGAF